LIVHFPPDETVTAEVEGMALAPEVFKLPEIVVDPVYVQGAAKITFPNPEIVTAPVPLIALLKVSVEPLTAAVSVREVL